MKGFLIVTEEIKRNRREIEEIDYYLSKALPSAARSMRKEKQNHLRVIAHLEKQKAAGIQYLHSNSLNEFFK